MSDQPPLDMLPSLAGPSTPASKFVMGIDPGITGAIALFYDGIPYNAIDLPTMQRNKKGNAQMLNGALLADIMGERPIKHCYLELVKGMPRTKGGASVMGSTSAFNFGRTFGALEQALHSARIPFSLVPPEVWKRRAGLIGADKDASRTAALRLWPALSQLLARKKDVGRAEAMLIAYYGSALLERAAEVERRDPFGEQKQGYGA